LLVFVEVKARNNLNEAMGSLQTRQKRRIEAAETCLAVYGREGFCDIRFDAILVAPSKLPRHIPAAFLDELKV
jgi:putative endonuclease